MFLCEWICVSPVQMSIYYSIVFRFSTQPTHRYGYIETYVFKFIHSVNIYGAAAIEQGNRGSAQEANFYTRM